MIGTVEVSEFMNLSRRQLLHNMLMVVVLGFVSCFLHPVSAQTKSEQTSTADESQSSPNAQVDDEKRNEPRPHEQTIYVPYNKLRDVFEQQGRGVFLPYEKFQELWQAARSHAVPVPTPAHPVDSLITEIDSEAEVGQEVVTVNATLRIELLKPGWTKVPLRLSDAAIRSATIAGETARIITLDDGHHFLLIENPDKKSRQVELKLEYVRAYEKSPGKNSVRFFSPQASVNRWRVRVPQDGIKINIQPLIAAAELTPQPNASDKSTESQGSQPETAIVAFVGATPQVQIEWTAKAEGATGLTALATAQAVQEVMIDEGIARTRATLRYEISRAQLSKLVVDVPLDQKIVNVYDNNVRRWEINEVNSMRRIEVELFEPAAQQQTLVIEMEQGIDQAGPVQQEKIEASVPIVKAVDVGRQQGTVVVRVAPALRAEVTERVGVLQLDSNELPPSVKDQTWNFAYRYTALPYSLKLSLEKVQPKISVTQLVEAYIEPEQIQAELMAVYNIENAGVFQLELQIPNGFEVRQVRGATISDAPALQVDTHDIPADNPTRMNITLQRKAIGRVGLKVELVRRLTDNNLLTPTGSSSTLPVPIPQAKQILLDQVSGRLVIYSPESLRINPNVPQGLRAIAVEEAFDGIASSRNGRMPALRPVLAYAFAEQPASLDIVAERRKPFVTAGQRLAVRVESGVIRYEALIMFEIEYSGVKSLRIDVPTAIASELRNPGPLRDRPVEPLPNDVAEGYVAKSYAGSSELIGKQNITLTWEQKIGELDIGKSIEISVPHLRPMGTDRAWGQIVLAKNETLDIEPLGTPQGLRPIDPDQDVFPTAKIEKAAWALEFHDNWTLNLSATRYQMEEVKRTSIERALVRTIITRGGQLGVQALYRIRSARQRLTIKLPSDSEYDANPLRINGSPVPLERGNPNELFVPLVGQNAEQPFVLDLRYTHKGNQQKLEMPEFPEDPAAQKVYYSVFLPKELVLIDYRGNWTDEWTWSNQGFKRVPLANQTDSALESWVTDQIPISSSPPFQHDGTSWLFSTLKPQVGVNGTLALQVVDERIFAAIIFAALIAIGLIWLVRPVVEKLVVVALIVGAIIACGIFLPTLAHQLLNISTYAAMAVVGLLWTALHTGRSCIFLSQHWTNSTPRPKQSNVVEASVDTTNNSVYEPMKPSKSNEAEVVDSPATTEETDGIEGQGGKNG